MHSENFEYTIGPGSAGGSHVDRPTAGGGTGIALVGREFRTRHVEGAVRNPHRPALFTGVLVGDELSAVKGERTVGRIDRTTAAAAVYNHTPQRLGRHVPDP